ncbi:MAG: hypothetical protein KAI83_14200 [Thiomargarita sp.]|nr:hypothetical protein [Thiomargarita sp.]
MKHTFTIEWAALGSALIILTLSLIISIALIFYSDQNYNEIVQWERKKDSEFGTAERNYTILQETLNNFTHFSLYKKRYRKLIKEGFFLKDQKINIGEQRAKIRDDIDRLLHKHPLFSRELLVLEKKIYIEPHFVIKDEFKIYQIPIDLKLSLLHEGDFLNLIKDIENYHRQSIGLFNWQKCDIKRNHEKIDKKDISKPYINANCVLNWFISRIDEVNGE